MYLPRWVSLQFKNGKNQFVKYIFPYVVTDFFWRGARMKMTKCLDFFRKFSQIFRLCRAIFAVDTLKTAKAIKFSRFFEKLSKSGHSTYVRMDCKNKAT